MKDNSEKAYFSKAQPEMPLFDTGAKVRNFGPEQPASMLPAPSISAHARRTDPETSHKAAASVNNQSTVKQAIRNVLKAAGKPLHDQEIVAGVRQLMGSVTDSGIRTRRNELVADREVIAAGVGKTQSGRDCQLWRLK